MHLRVKKSSLIFDNCLDLFTGKGQVGRTVHKSLTDVHWLRLRKRRPARSGTGEDERQAGLRFPHQIQGTLRVQSTCDHRETLASPKSSSEVRYGTAAVSANRSLLLRAYYVPGQGFIPLTSHI